jgi:predicted aspartyl protease
VIARLAAGLAFAVPLAAQMPAEHSGHTEQLGRVRFAGPRRPHIDTRRGNMVLLVTVSGAIMPDAMGSFRVDVEIENPARPGDRRTVRAVLVDTGAELSWLPAEVLESLGIERHTTWRFRQADGTIIERWTGPAFLHVAGKRATDDVVFGEPGDLVLLGSRTLEGLNFRVEPVTKRLVDAGPAPAAATAVLLV